MSDNGDDDPSDHPTDEEDVFVPLGSSEDRERWERYRPLLEAVDRSKTPEQFHQALAEAIKGAYLADEEGLEFLAILSMRPLEKKSANRPLNWRLRNRIFIRYCSRAANSEFPNALAKIKHLRAQLETEGHHLSQDGAKSLYYSVKKSGVWWPQN